MNWGFTAQHWYDKEEWSLANKSRGSVPINDEWTWGAKEQFNCRGNHSTRHEPSSTETWQWKIVENRWKSPCLSLFIHVYPFWTWKTFENRQCLWHFMGQRHPRSPKPRRQRPNVRISLEQICGMRSSAGFRMWLRSRSVVPDGHVEVSQ
jgi:hypothetical protein